MEHAHKEHPKYMRIFWILLVLTILEVVVALPLLKSALGADCNRTSANWYGMF